MHQTPEAESHLEYAILRGRSKHKTYITLDTRSNTPVQSASALLTFP